MVNRGEIEGIEGKAVLAVGPGVIRAALPPTLLIGGLLLLICP
jgi:hypothetical protein